MKTIAKFILYNIMGFKIVGDYPKDLKKFIIIGAPHTSNYDFILGVLMKTIKGIDAKFVGKHTLFKPPYGFIFKALGGYPVDRSKSDNIVQAIIDIINKEETFILAMAPEGTRKKRDKWKTGFYHIALGANIPIIFNTFDFGKREYLISEPYYLTGDKEKDFAYFHDFYKDVKGRFPDQFEPDFHKSI